MVKPTRLPYTAHKATRGVLTWYYRRGSTWVKLPGDPGKDPEAAKVYWAARTGMHERKSAATFNSLMESYRKSPRWLALKPLTKRDYERVMTYLSEKVGDRSAIAIERRHVIQAQQDNSERARFANYIVQVLSILMEHAINLGWRRDNPAKGVSLLKTGEGYHPWPAWALTAFRHEADGPVLTAFELALGTGQRIGDVLAMRWDQIEDDGVIVKQSKTGAELWAPFTDALRRHLSCTPRRGLTIVSNDLGRPMTYTAIRQRLDAPRKRSGASAYSFHGLRYNAASELYEAGCSDAQVQAITGHKTRAMAAKYGKGARQRVLAREARERRK